MPIRHVIQPGDTVESIAYAHGLFWETVWNAEENTELRRLRKSPNILAEGDVLVVPDKRVESVDAATGKRHRFRLKGIPSVLNVRLLEQGVPRSGVAWTVEANGRTLTGTTDADGRLQCFLMPDVTAGTLRIDATGEVYAFDIGRVNPGDSTIGIQTRLRNLGFYGGEIDGVMGEATAAAIRALQRAAGLTESGDADEATLAALDDFPAMKA